jgi:hypothetical protein
MSNSISENLTTQLKKTKKTPTSRPTKTDGHQRHHLLHFLLRVFLAPSAPSHQQQSLFQAAEKKQNISKKNNKIKKSQ